MLQRLPYRLKPMQTKPLPMLNLKMPKKRMMMATPEPYTIILKTKKRSKPLRAKAPRLKPMPLAP